MSFPTRTNIAVAVAASLLASACAFVVFERWRHGDSDAFEAMWQAHADSIGAMEPGGTYELLAFPGRVRLDELPTFPVRVSRHRTRGPDFTDLPASGTTRIVALGDSATFGTGVAEEHRFTEVLAREVESARPGCCEVINAGWPGANARNVADRLDDALRWGANVVIVNSGANDARDPDQPFEALPVQRQLPPFNAALDRIITTAAAQDVPLVLWANHEVATSPSSIAALGEAMEARAARAGIPFVDLEAIYAERPATVEEQRWFLANDPFTTFNELAFEDGFRIEEAALQSDWVHPNRFGHARLADALLPHVLTALGAPDVE